MWCEPLIILGKASYFLAKWKGEERLKLFRADLRDEGSFDEAVKGCDGVFHVAALMEFSIREQADIGKLQTALENRLI